MVIIARKDALDLEGKCLDRYHFFHLLESRENVPVYLGCDIHNERKVAIKVVHIDYADDIRSQLFNEKSLLTAIVHPHIVHKLDFVESPPLALLVTEYAARGSLRNSLHTHTKLPVATCVKYITQAADALQHMHNRGYIHRDVKPENMLLTADDNILLCDLGIAMPIPSSEDRIDSMGTASYAAPEQINGYPSPKSDQYSLATVAYELLCGTPPFSGPESHLVWKQILHTPTLPNSRSKKLPPTAEQIIRKALAKEPEERFERIEIFAQELGNALHSLSTLSTELGSAPHSPSIFSTITEEVEGMHKTPETTDCEQ